MPGTAGDALLASADANMPDATLPEVSDPSADANMPDATLPEVSDPDGLEHLAETVGFQVEATESDRLTRFPSAAIKVRKPDLKKCMSIYTKLTICEGEDGTESSLGDVLIFPDMIRYRGLTHFNVDNFVQEMLVKDKEWSPGSPGLLKDSYVFVCCHGSRGKRCGVCGPALIERFKEETNGQGLDGQVAVGVCSHVGGHEYAGNLIIFSLDAKGEVIGHWYGYVAPGDVPVQLHKHIDLGEIVENILRSHLGLSGQQQKRSLKQIAEEPDEANGTGNAVLSMPVSLDDDRVIDIGSVRMSWDSVVYMDARNCFVWKFYTGDPMMVLSLLDLINPFPPQHSSIVCATATWHLRILVRHSDELWFSQSWRDWSGMAISILQDMLSRVNGIKDFLAIGHTCKFWHLAASWHPGPLLYHPYAMQDQWLFITPGGRSFSKHRSQNYRLFPARKLNEQSNLIGGSGQHLLFLCNSVCSIVNIHTGNTRALPLPSGSCGVYRGILSSSAESWNSNILLVTGSSVLGKSVNGSDEWRVQHFVDMNVGPLDDILFIGDTAYMIDNKGRLYIITADFEIRHLNYGTYSVHAPRGRHGFGKGMDCSRRCRPKVICRKNWLMERNGELLRLSYMTCHRDAELSGCGFFMSRYGTSPIQEFFKSRYVLPPSHRLISKNWFTMDRDDIGDVCIFLNWVTPAATFLSDNPARWGLKSRKVYQCGSNMVPWLSVDLGWQKDDRMIVFPENWLSPVFMNSGFSFLPEEEMDKASVTEDEVDYEAEDDGDV